MVGLRMIGAILPLRFVQVSGMRFVSGQSGIRMISGARFPTLQQQKQPEESGHGFRGCCILKPLGSRGFASNPSGSGSGKGKSLFFTIGGTTLFLAGASYVYLQTEDGRKQSQHLFTWVDKLLGVAPVAPTLSQIKDSIRVETKGKGITTSNSLMRNNNSKPESALNPDKPLVNQTSKDAICAEKSEEGIEMKCGDTECLHKMDKEEKMIAKANSELEKVLKDVKPKAVEYTEAALKAYCEATDSIKLFMDKVYCAIEEDSLESPRYEEIWCDIYDTALKRCEKVKEAQQKAQCAWELLFRLREVIENGKACKFTSCNPLLITAEDSLKCADRELFNAKSKLDCVQSDSILVDQYKTVVEDFRREVKAEFDSMMPSDDCKATLNGNECTMIITHAYKKVIRLQKELAQVQMSTELRKQFERDIIEALKRQAIAYQENFDNQINVMKSEYERKLKQQDKISEAERVVELRAKYGKASAALAAIESGIEARQILNAKSQKLRKLWATCNTLFSRINYAQYYVDDDNVHDYASIKKDDLAKDFSNDQFASQLIGNLPEKVSNFEDLKQRFFDKLEPTCRKTMILKDGESISLWKYALGSLESVLIARCAGERKEGKQTHEILDRTSFHLKRGELLEATVALNSLTGLPRQISKDWIDDAKGVLETNQTLFTLMTYAASNNVF